MSSINHFALGLIKRQISIYNENKSLKYDTTQPLTTLICCSVILFTDFLQNHKEDNLIESIFKHDSHKEFLKVIEKTYEKSLDKRVSYCISELIKKKSICLKEGADEDLKKYITFFHDLRNEFAHLIEENKSKVIPNNDVDIFNGIIIKIGESNIPINKDDFIEILNLLNNHLPNE